MSLATDLDQKWQRNFEASQKRRLLKEQAVAYLGGHCQICGYNRCISAFDFHHTDPNTKDFTISERMVWSAELEAELKKTILLCANCHREVHAGWHPKYIVLEDDERGGSIFEDDLGFVIE